MFLSAVIGAVRTACLHVSCHGLLLVKGGVTVTCVVRSAACSLLASLMRKVAWALRSIGMKHFLPCIICFATHGIVIIVVIGGTCQSAGTGLHGLYITCLVHVQVP